MFDDKSFSSNSDGIMILCVVNSFSRTNSFPMTAPHTVLRLSYRIFFLGGGKGEKIAFMTFDLS